MDTIKETTSASWEFKKKGQQVYLKQKWLHI